MTALVGARVVGEHRHPAIVERFTTLEGELTVKRDGRTGILGEGETAVVEAGVWHDSPPPVVQRAISGVLAPVARRRGYRATYPQISRTVLAPRPQES